MACVLAFSRFPSVKMFRRGYVASTHEMDDLQPVPRAYFDAAPVRAGGYQTVVFDGNSVRLQFQLIDNGGQRPGRIQVVEETDLAIDCDTERHNLNVSGSCVSVFEDTQLCQQGSRGLVPSRSPLSDGALRIPKVLVDTYSINDLLDLYPSRFLFLVAALPIRRPWLQCRPQRACHRERGG